MWPFDKQKMPISDFTLTAECGHETKVRDEVTAHGVTITTTIPIKDGKTDYCHRCLETMSIHCAWCGRPIFVGDPVTLYVSTDDYAIPDYAVKHEDDAYVGCLRGDCAETGADRAGFWYPPGQVKLDLSPLEAAIEKSGLPLVKKEDVPEETANNCETFGDACKRIFKG